MGRIPLIVVACTLALVTLLLPATSYAGTFTWDLTTDFTAVGQGANPDHDHYGATPWTYVESAANALVRDHNPRTFHPLGTFATGIQGGLAGWSDPTDSATLVGVNPTGAPITGGGDTFAPGRLVMTPGPDRLVAIGWTSPLAHRATVQVTGSVSADGSGVCVGGPTWSLDQNGSQLASGTAASGTISASPVINPRGTIFLTVDYAGAYNQACDTAGVTLQVQLSGTHGPHLTLAIPGGGALVSGRQPIFSGSASTAFGVSSAVTVRVYGGSSATGTPLQTLTTSASGATYTVTTIPPLPDGVYTAQAEQDDQATPPDVGLSATETFRVENAPPTIKLGSLGRQPLLTATPTLTGVDGTATAAPGAVTLVVYPGDSTLLAPVRYVSGAVRAGGRYSITITPALRDGQYTVVTTRGVAGGGLAFSAPTTFRIKLHAPVVTLRTPAAGSSTSQRGPFFSGAAGDSLGDSSRVTVLLYAGATTSGKPIGTLPVTRTGGKWSRRWSQRLALGRYTAVATQRDDVGHTAVSKPHTFLIVPGPSVIGATVRVSRSGLATVSITCIAPSGFLCTGDVLILTLRSFTTGSGGPAGHLRVMFAYVSIPSGRTRAVSRAVPSDLARALRLAGTVQVRVTAVLTQSGASPRTFSAVRPLSFVA